MSCFAGKLNLLLLILLIISICLVSCEQPPVSKKLYFPETGKKVVFLTCYTGIKDPLINFEVCG